MPTEMWFVGLALRVRRGLRRYSWLATMRSGVGVRGAHFSAG